MNSRAPVHVVVLSFVLNLIRYGTLESSPNINGETNTHFRIHRVRDDTEIAGVTEIYMRLGKWK